MKDQQKMNNLNTLAIDIGTTTGWAISGPPIISGTISFKPKRFEGGGMRVLRFKNWLHETITQNNIQVIYYEEVRRHMGTDAAHIYGALEGQISSQCEELKIPYQGIPVGTIKKHATGSGNASKDVMINTAKAAFPDQQIDDDNQADALWILDLGLKGKV
jgi:Holliday junction resolvasome RuvABC endonuclease subunit